MKTHARQGFMNFVTVDKIGGNTLFPITFGKFLLIWIIRVKSAKSTYCHGEYSVTINDIYKGSHFFRVYTSAWDNENLGKFTSWKVQITVTLRLSSQVFQVLYFTCHAFFLIQYYSVTHWSLNNSHLGFLDTHTRCVQEYDTKNLWLPFFFFVVLIEGLERLWIKAVPLLEVQLW